MRLKAVQSLKFIEKKYIFRIHQTIFGTKRINKLI